jgi:hypothetical protein
MLGKSEICFTNLEYRCILYFCGPTQKIPLVKHCMLPSSEASNTRRSLDFQLKSRHIDKYQQVGPIESYTVSDTQLEALLGRQQ